ncbi:ATPase [Bacteroidia bacterium]|nr:ATPase [Bacteroidia bacterium]GHV70820.1 ATPase [Bacteroidia bacterium]
MFINREIEQYIQPTIDAFSVIAITGPRQSGKTTLIKQMFQNFGYYSLENPDILAIALRDPVSFLSQNERMIIDEVQHAPALFSYIQGIVDDNPARKFILSGSSNFLLMKRITQSLAGRVAIFELLPFSYGEIYNLVEEKSMDELLFSGLYPSIYSSTKTPQQFYSNYVKTYIERDVRDLLNIKDLMQFHAFLKLCAGRIGSLFNVSDLSNEVGVSVATINSWLSVLQASYIIFLLPPYFENINKRLVKHPKLYFVDTGLSCYLLDIENCKQLERDKMRGHLFENFIVTNYLKNRLNKGKTSNLYFYRDSNKNEVDLLLLNGKLFEAIEIKSSQTYHPDFEKGLVAFEKVFGNRVQNKQIIYCGGMENTAGKIKLLNYKHIND